MAKCQRDGCEEQTKRAKSKYCSCRCNGIATAARRPAGFYPKIQALARAASRKKGHKALKQSDVMLMAQGRYAEAALAIYDRGYSAGWVSCKNGRHQLPQRRIA